MTETIRVTSMITTATARTGVPQGSPVRCSDHLGVVEGCEYGGEQGRSCGDCNQPGAAGEGHRQQGSAKPIEGISTPTKVSLRLSQQLFD